MLIIKIGGGATINIPGVIADLAELDEQFVVVHGANALRVQLAQQLGWEHRTITSVSGYSSVFSDDRTIDLQMMIYAGLRNKRIVELCQREGINAIGLSGLDGRVIQGRRNKGIRVREKGKVKVVRDLSGKPQTVNVELLRLLLDHGYTPVLAVPIVDEDGCAINSENDDIVNVLQDALHAEKIVQLIEAPGFIDPKNDSKPVVKEITKEELVRREEQVDGRMKRKMLALRRLFEKGAATVLISDGRVEHPIRDALAGAGTTIR